MNIGFVCDEYPPGAHGGIGTMVQTLGRALVGAGHKVRVAGLYSNRTETTREIDEGVTVWRLPAPGGTLRWIQSRRQLFRQVEVWARQGDIDLVEVPDWQGPAAYWPSLPVPVVTRLNGSATYFAAEMGRRSHWLTTHLEGSSLRRSDFWCSVSHYTAQKTKVIWGLPSGPHAILPNPVRVGPPAAWERRQPGMVVFSGTLTEKKGVIPLVDAWRGVARRFPAATLHLVGKDGTAPGGGSMTTYLRARLDEGASRVRFHGHVARERVLELLAEARVAVFPSFAEAFAIAPLEAMAAGCPTIATALGSGPELLENGVDGLTVDPRRSHDIELAIGRLLADEEFARQLAQTGRRKVEDRFSIGRLLAANVQFYRECVTSHGATSHVSRAHGPTAHVGAVRKAAVSVHEDQSEAATASTNV